MDAIIKKDKKKMDKMMDTLAKKDISRDRFVEAGRKALSKKKK